MTFKCGNSFVFCFCEFNLVIFEIFPVIRKRRKEAFFSELGKTSASAKVGFYSPFTVPSFYDFIILMFLKGGKEHILVFHIKDFDTPLLQKCRIYL